MYRKFCITLSLLLFAFTFACFAQTGTKISRRCPGNPPVVGFSKVELVALGDVYLVPCNGRNVFINGSSSAGLITSINGQTAPAQLLTVTGADTAAWSTSGSNTNILALPITAITGASPRATFYPNLSGDNTLATSPFSWSGAIYNWSNTALSATFTMAMRPSSTLGFFTAGTTTNNFTITQATNSITNQLAPTTGTFNVSDATNFFTTITANTDTFNITNTTSDNRIEFISTAAGSLKLGDCFSTTNDCISQLYGAGTTTITALNLVKLQNSAATSYVELNGAGDILTLLAPQGITLNSGTTTTAIGDVLGAGNNTLFQVTDSSQTISLLAADTHIKNEISIGAASDCIGGGTIGGGGTVDITALACSIDATARIFVTYNNTAVANLLPPSALRLSSSSFRVRGDITGTFNYWIINRF